MILLFSSPVFFTVTTFATPDSINTNQTIKDGNPIVSDGEMFELGFFSPGNSKNRYLGIWYKKISTGTVVWVANRETPIKDYSGMLKLTKHGNLIILSGGSTMIWSSNSSVSMRSDRSTLVLQLLDNGNLVVWDKSRTKDSIVWQSFDYPGHTVLPGMKIGKDLVTGRERYMTTWKSIDDPAPGLYRHWVDTNGYPQLFITRGPVLVARFGPWNGLKFQGVPFGNQNPIYSLEFVVNEKEVYYKYEIKNSIFQRILVMPDVNTLHLRWNDQVQDWDVFGNQIIDTCSGYGFCGPYGSCSINTYPPCKCMEGFRPHIENEWNSGNWSSGCQRKKALQCGIGDGFRKLSGVKFPDTRRSWYNRSMTLAECEVACRRNCSCTAYANLDIRNGGSGCLLWFDDLIDIREYDEKQDLYIRMAASELAGEGNEVPPFSFKNKRVLAVVLPTSSAVLILCIVAYSCIKKKEKERSYMKGRGNWNSHHKKNSDVHMEDLDDLPFYSLYKLAKATDNFSIDNKIGEGGFGPVYKGVLEDGQEVAVKRHSETSQQGLDEFKNELKFIAKFQHRNLVKLLGYCIHESEMILIYEYMTNKSLDSFLFDETRSSMLDWPQRFRIIHGMARGILYLHQDSRLQIIHRDLKASNILLDAEMNPKISDFGLARKFVGSDTAAMTKKVVGTYGYISPEYAVHGRFSVKSDVFSFGVLVLEIVSGKKNRGFFHEDHSDNLLGHAWRLFQEGRPVELMSASLHDSCIVSEVFRSIHVALLCVQNYAKDRPTMLSVVLMLVSDGVLPQPKPPAFYTGESRSQVEKTVSSANENMITLVYAR
uniref:G-type lectin S-receptor-like serine/threonine-protein kinase At4g27290 n=1 Tax=Erigeron canadensis TaxID=72917 RepID=UPI001CB985F7|nr:G-type lectin S-receptor-like serine/threonine-protein kinase At4g27290 [Erigeron canadensis]